jgi:hypothetical protein
MSDDWNIKEYEEHVEFQAKNKVDSFIMIEHKKAGGQHAKAINKISMRYYGVSIIEILRKQLIQDLQELTSDIMELDGSEIVEIIDRRFGVKK